MNYAIYIYIVLFIAILLKYLYTVFIGIISIYCCIYTCILLSLGNFTFIFPLIYVYKFYCPRACYICKITIAIFNLVKAGLLYLINYIIVYLCIVSSYKEEPCDEAAHW